MLESNIVALSFEAGADLSSDLTAAGTATAGFRRFVSLDATGKVVQSNLVDLDVMGVCQGKPEADQVTAVAVSGVVLVQAAEAIAIGEPVASDNNGLATTTVALTTIVQGIALSAASAAGDLILVKLGQRATNTALT